MKAINKIFKNRLLFKNIKFRYNNFDKYNPKFVRRKNTKWTNFVISYLYPYNLDNILYYHCIKQMSKSDLNNKKFETRLIYIKFNKLGKQLNYKIVIIKDEKHEQ
jgi:hypothetical protein